MNTKCCKKCSSVNMAGLMKDIGQGSQNEKPYSCTHKDCTCHNEEIISKYPTDVVFHTKNVLTNIEEEALKKLEVAGGEITHLTE